MHGGPSMRGAAPVSSVSRSRQLSGSSTRSAYSTAPSHAAPSERRPPAPSGAPSSEPAVPASPSLSLCSAADAAAAGPGSPLVPPPPPGTASGAGRSSRQYRLRPSTARSFATCAFCARRRQPHWPCDLVGLQRACQACAYTSSIPALFPIQESPRNASQAYPGHLSLSCADHARKEHSPPCG